MEGVHRNIKNIKRLVQSTVSSSLMIQDLIVELVVENWYNEYNVKISLLAREAKNHFFHV